MVYTVWLTRNVGEKTLPLSGENSGSSGRRSGDFKRKLRFYHSHFYLAAYLNVEFLKGIFALKRNANAAHASVGPSGCSGKNVFDIVATET